MIKGIVFFFEGEHKAWFASNVTYSEKGIRGYVLDGCWWMDYNTETETVKVCIAKQGPIDWDNPVNTFKTKLVTQIAVPQEVEGSAFELLQWARKEKGEHDAIY